MSVAPGQEPRLVVSGECGRLGAGILAGDRWLAREERPGNLLEELAPLLRRVLAAAEVEPAALATWIYSGGPGSLLGLRSLAMTLETWAAAGPPRDLRRLRFSGMVWTARHQLAAGGPDRFLLASPWRTGAWNLLRVDGAPPSEEDLSVHEGTPEADDDRPILVLGARPGAPPPEAARQVALPPFESLAARVDEPGFLRPTDRTEPLETGVKRYRKWSPAAREAR